ncbi:acetyl-CoA carboxylase biotin carboxylase subunit family protein [Streptomyces luteogriseus]|uniref:acetyl-CoA carboxylase biotin carboxylase subunit family protein n=1 Tax=Streptomyces luteogriseus TaxID=68233 RepID=UPI0037BC7543
MSVADMSGRDVLVLVDSDHADTPYDTWAAEAGVRPHLLVSRARYPQYRHVPGTRAFDDYASGGQVERVALELGERVSPLAVVARAEGDLLRAARLREVLGVPGQDWPSALAFRDKVVMKTQLRRQGLEVPEFTAVRTPVDLLAFAAEHGYPVVVKPAYGSGSTGTQVLRGPDDLDALLAAGLPEHPEVERFVEGAMYVVDGLFTQGAVRSAFVSRYVNDCLAFRAGGHLGSAQLTRDDPLTPRLISYARQVLGLLPTSDCTTFHLEVFHTPDDRLVLCEVASRTGGALTAAAIRAASGIDLDREWFLAQTGAAPSLTPGMDGAAPGRSAGWVVFYPERGTLTELPLAPPEFVVEQRLRGRVGTTYRGGQKSGVYLAGYVVTGADADEVEQRLHELAAWYASGVRWRE